MKILIIGYSGSGKSTLAKKLANKYNLALLYLDNVQFLEGNWQIRNKEEQENIVNKFIENNSNFVIDGSYLDSFQKRFEIADMLIFLDYNRVYCFRKAFKRYLENKNNIRESCHCKEKFDFEFIFWLLYKGRTKKRRNSLEKCYQDFKGQKYRFKSVFELKGWLE